MAESILLLFIKVIFFLISIISFNIFLFLLVEIVVFFLVLTITAIIFFNTIIFI